MWRGSVVVPLKLQRKVTDELFAMHPGISRMKSLACQHVWWPIIDQNGQGVQCLPNNLPQSPSSLIASLGMATATLGSCMLIMLAPFLEECSLF